MKNRVPLVNYLVLDDEHPHLTAQQCVHCGVRYFERRNACAACGETGFSTVDVSTEGSLHTYTIVHVAAPGVVVPFVAGVVDCGGTPVRANIVNVDPAALQLGMKLQLTTAPVPVDSTDTEVIGFGFEPMEALP